VKEKLKQAWAKVGPFLKWRVSTYISIALIFSMFASSAFLVLEAPQIQKAWFRYTVGSKVVKVIKTDSKGRPRGGGTGFAIKAPSGKTYIMTNAHVCDMYEGSKNALVQFGDGPLIPTRIIQISDKTDLCLMENVNEMKGLSLASSLAVGEVITVVGHPALMPLNISTGDVLGNSKVDVNLGIVGLDINREDCHLPKHRMEASGQDVDMGFLVYCVEHIRSIQTTAINLPGNSGSPVVNFFGHVVGVLFAGDDEVHWSLIISLEDINTFLAPY
jgi:S1-C subfamily serine protease